MLLRANGGGQLIVLRALRAVEDNGWSDDGGATLPELLSITGRSERVLWVTLQRAITSSRARRLGAGRRGTNLAKHPKADARFWVTTIGRDFIDLQERVGAPPDPFRDPVGYARWLQATAGVPIPNLVRVDKHTGAVLGPGNYIHVPEVQARLQWLQREARRS